MGKLKESLANSILKGGMRIRSTAIEIEQITSDMSKTELVNFVEYMYRNGFITQSDLKMFKEVNRTKE